MPSSTAKSTMRSILTPLVHHRLDHHPLWPRGSLRLFAPPRATACDAPRASSSKSLKTVTSATPDHRAGVGRPRDAFRVEDEPFEEHLLVVEVVGGSASSCSSTMNARLANDSYSSCFCEWRRLSSAAPRTRATGQSRESC